MRAYFGARPRRAKLPREKRVKKKSEKKNSSLVGSFRFASSPRLTYLSKTNFLVLAKSFVTILQK